MNDVTGAAQLASLARLLRRGPYTNDPEDQAYGNHHHAEPQAAGETLQAAYPATIKAGGLSTMGMVRQTDQVVYVDPARLPSTGVVGRAGNIALSVAGLNTGRRYDAEAVQISQQADNHLTISTPDGVQVTARTDGFVGKPSELSAGQQLLNAWKLAKG